MLFALTFTACSDDDDDDDGRVEKSGEFFNVFSVDVAGVKDQISETASNKPIELNLSAIIGEDNAKYLISGSSFSRGECYIGIQGLGNVSETVTLKDFTIKVGNKSTNLGTCSISGSGNTFMSDYNYSSDKFTDVVKLIFDAQITSAKKANIFISFTPSEDVNRDKNVKLVIKVAGLYKYKALAK